MKELNVDAESREKAKQGKRLREEKYYSKEWVRDNITLASLVIEACMIFTYDLVEDCETLETEIRRFKETYEGDDLK